MSAQTDSASDSSRQDGVTGEMPVPIAYTARHLFRTYRQFIDVSDLRNPDPEEVRRNTLSRCLAAHAIASLCDLSPDRAAATVTDGYQDNGIDAVYYDRPRRMIFAVQAKWSDKGNKGIDAGDATLSFDGLRNLIDGNFRDVNDKLRAFEKDLLDSFEDSSTQFTLVVCSTAARPLSAGIAKILQGKIKKCNGTGGLTLVHMDVFDQARIYKSLLSSLDPQQIQLRIVLRDWGRVETPFLAYYGQIAVGDVFGWKETAGRRLFHRNLRNMISRSDVQLSIADTLANHRESFWYFNNGATLLCERIEKLPIYGDERSEGRFDCHGVSVVNGAQTVGAIWEFGSTGAELDPQSRMLVRLISLQGTPDGFAQDVTRNTNHQQKIETKDFVSLDRKQHDLQKELLLLDGIAYAFRTGDQKPQADKGCDFEEAAVALACAEPDLTYATTAYREIGLLWANIDREPYTRLFRRDLEASRLWRAVLVKRRVDQAMATTKIIAGVQRSKAVATMGRCFVAHCVFTDPVFAAAFKNRSVTDAACERLAEEITNGLYPRVAKFVDRNAGGNRSVQQFFKSVKLSREIKDSLSAEETSGASPHRSLFPGDLD